LHEFNCDRQAHRQCTRHLLQVASANEGRSCGLVAIHPGSLTAKHDAREQKKRGPRPHAGTERQVDALSVTETKKGGGPLLGRLPAAREEALRLREGSS